jgi:hypothetical protein
MSSHLLNGNQKMLSTSVIALSGVDEGVDWTNTLFFLSRFVFYERM